MLKLIKYLKSYWILLLIVVVAVFFQVQADLALPDYMSRIVNEGIITEDQDFILNTGLEMLLVSLGGGILTIFAGFLVARISTGFARRLREDLFTHIENFSLKEMHKFSIASLITRSTNDVQQVQGVLGNFLRPMLMAPIMGIGAVMRAYNTAPSMSWILALAVALLIAIMAVTFHTAIPKFKLLQKLVDKLNQVSRENLTGLRVIRAFNTEDYEEEKFDGVNEDLTKVNLFVNRVMVILMPLMMLLFNLTTIAIIWFGAKLIGDEMLQIGEMMAFMQYAMQVIFSFLMISIMFIMVPRAAVSIDRINEVFESKPSVIDPEIPAKLGQEVKGRVEFKNVSFAYEGAKEPVVHDISFVAEPGKVTAIIGSTGSGKSTLVNLVPRFYDAESGSIEIDGVDVRDLNQVDLRSLVSYVPQKPVLFSGTVESNIKYDDPDGSNERMVTCAEIAQISTFIEDLPDKYKTNMAQGGVNFSGGQKQRISIARALFKECPIYIFDDSFSALDFKTDSMLRKDLRVRLKGKTTIIVSQRIGTIMDADQIIVLADNGRIAGIGKHKDLLAECIVYREIAQSQLSEDDLKKVGGDNNG